jgi:hypothetical protein
LDLLVSAGLAVVGALMCPGLRSEPMPPPAAPHERSRAPTATAVPDEVIEHVMADTSAWADRLQEHNRLVERQVARFGGRLIPTSANGTLAMFDGPARAITCATPPETPSGIWISNSGPGSTLWMALAKSEVNRYPYR